MARWWLCYQPAIVRLAHIVNPLVARVGSDLDRAQPMTLQSMRVAKAAADQAGVGVRQYAAFYPEDRAAVPPELAATAVLERSAIDLVPATNRKLPLLADILDRLYDAAHDADYMIYSNIDIGLRPEFYIAVARIIGDGSDAFLVGRNTVDTTCFGTADLERVLAQPGIARAGFSCFVFPRAHYPDYELDETCIGVQPVGVTLAINVIQHAQQFRNITSDPLTFHLGDAGAWQSRLLDEVHRHNERALDRIAARLGRDGLEPRAAEILQTYQRWRSEYVIARCTSQHGRAIDRIARKAGFIDWVAGRYDRAA
jgi:hypothetical protein